MSMIGWSKAHCPDEHQNSWQLQLDIHIPRDARSIDDIDESQSLLAKYGKVTRCRKLLSDSDANKMPWLFTTPFMLHLDHVPVRPQNSSLQNWGLT